MAARQLRMSPGGRMPIDLRSLPGTSAVVHDRDDSGQLSVRFIVQPGTCPPRGADLWGRRNSESQCRRQSQRCFEATWIAAGAPMIRRTRPRAEHCSRVARLVPSRHTSSQADPAALPGRLPTTERSLPGQSNFESPRVDSTPAGHLLLFVPVCSREPTISASGRCVP